MSVCGGRPPELFNKDVSRVVCKYFNFTSIREDLIKSFPSYEDRNYYFIGSNDDYKDGEFILKLSNPHGILIEELQGINDLMNHLKSCGLSLTYPLPSQTGADIVSLSHAELIAEDLSGIQSLSPTNKENEVNSMEKSNGMDASGQLPEPQNGLTYYMRVLAFVPGKLFHYVEKTCLVPSLMYEYGEMLGRMDKEMMDNFSNEALAQRQMREWNLMYFVVSTKKKIIDLACKSKVEKIIKGFEQCVSPRLASLRQSIIHHDAHDMNVVLEDKLSSNKRFHFKAFIDFGDTIKTCTIFELAVCLSHIMMYNLRPVTCSSSVELVGPLISGYNNILPLSEEELDCLYYLVLARCCLSGVNAEICNKAEPWNDYILTSACNCWLLVDELLAISKEEVDRIWQKYVLAGRRDDCACATNLV